MQYLSIDDWSVGSIPAELAHVDTELWLCQTALEFGRLGIFTIEEVNLIVLGGHASN